MGIETTKALQARKRESAAQIERLIARAGERDPLSSVRRARIKETARLARRKVRALAAAQQSVAAIEVELGQTLRRLLGQGLTRNEAFQLVGIRRHLGRRYVDLAVDSPPPQPGGLSTERPSDDAAGCTEKDLDLDGAYAGADVPGRKI